MIYSEESDCYSTFLLEIQRLLKASHEQRKLTDYFIYTVYMYLTRFLPFTPFGIFRKSFLPRAF